ncbi:MAG TPA: hypothetical protein VFE78_37725 [Gemmataceae bacterium]|nr:hypothetical protein [Gemmataceae bacterium]
MRASLLLVVALAAGCGGGPPPDEAKAKWFGEKAVTPAELEAAAKEHYSPATEDYFTDMDGVAGERPGEPRKLKLNGEEIKGRNAWVMWTGGNEAFWDWLARHSYGSFDLLKLLDSNDRGKRFARAGLLTEPGTRPPTADETKEAFGVRYGRPGPAKHVEASLPKERRPHAEVYGWPSGVVGLRLFPNPEFTDAAKARWDPELYYADTPAGRSYASRVDTIRPFRVGMSCGFCHIAPHPLSPPADREAPEWKDLSNNIGNQYLRFRVIFGYPLKPDNYLYHVLDAQLPGTIDTSLVASDNLNNPNTINAFYGLRARLARAEHNPPETIGPDTLAYLREFVQADFPSPHQVPRVLLDGSDSVGIDLALARVYLNIGTYHQQWVRLHNPLLGFRKQEPFKLKDTAANSLYWHATRIRVNPMKAFFLKATEPMLLKDAPRGQELGKLRGSGLPSDPAYARGREVFAGGCIACHSSIQPGDLPDLEAKLKGDQLPPPGASREGLRLRAEDLTRLTRGDGALPPAYRQWAREAVKQELFWKDNYLSTDVRIPVTLTHTNSARAMATNAVHGDVWEDFASQTYKELDSVGRIAYHDPFSGAEQSFQAPSGGPGYYRVPTLISIWATAPYLHNNALGKFTNDPSVAGRLDAFDDGITRLLWPERRREPSKQAVWHADKADPEVVDNASPEQLAADGGWVWRTNRESWLTMEGHEVPTFVAGLTGWPPSLVALVPWLPSLAFVLLGAALLLSGPTLSLRERLERRAPWLGRLFTPLRWLVAVGAFFLAGLTGFYVWWELWPTIQVLDVATQGSIPLLRLQASLLPIVLFASVGVLFSLDWLRAGVARRRVALGTGAVCLLLAVVVAFGFGRFASGRGGGVRLGPIPAGVPVNVLANMDPEISPEKIARRKAAREALIDFVLAYHRAAEGHKPGRKEFEERVAPALLGASKCPDFVTDRGHDYEFLRLLSDGDKKALVELLKTF